MTAVTSIGHYIEGPVLAYHGGYCCGIKTIHSLGRPNYTAPALEKNHYWSSDLDQGGERADYPMYNQNAPEETHLERVDRYIKYVDAVRPYGILEIALAQENPDDYDDISWCDPNQQNDWGPLLVERGFVEVTSCYNSNSGNRVHIYHRTKDKE